MHAELGTEGRASEKLQAWRILIFDRLAWFAAMLALVAVTFSLGRAFPASLTVPVALTLGFAVLAAVLRTVRLSIRLALLGIGFACALFGLAVQGVFAPNLFGLCVMWVVFATLLAGRRGGWVVVGAVSLIWAVAGWLSFDTTVTTAPFLDPADPWNWVRVIVVLACMGGVTLMAVSYLAGKLEGALLESELLLATVRAESEARLEAEKQLRHSQKLEALGALAGGVAHDFNNTLSVILGSAGLLLDELGDAEQLQLAEDIEHAAVQASTLTRQLLVFSRQDVIKLAPVDLGELLQTTGRSVRRLLPSDIDIQLHAAAGAWVVEADVGQLQQVILNLAINARDALAGSGGELSFSVEGDEDEVVLTVSDTGAGMTAEVLAKVFEPFFTTKPSGAGTGLGLATVRSVMEQAGGSVRAESKPGVGTTFSLRFPRSHADVDVRPIDESEPRGEGTVLVAEDDLRVRATICSSLEHQGYRALDCSDGREALRLLEIHHEEIDLLCTDYRMPHVDGARLIQEVRKRYPHIALLLVTGHANDVEAARRLVAEGVPVVVKPFLRAELLKAIRAALESRNQGRA